VAVCALSVAVVSLARMPGTLLPLAVNEAVDDGRNVLMTVLAVAGAIVVAFLVASFLAVVFRMLARRWEQAGELAHRARRPLRALLVLIGIWIALRLSTEPASWTPGVEHALTIALIIVLAWLLAQLAFVVEDGIASRYRIDVADNRHARRVRTQMQILRRLTGAVIVLVAVAAILFTFPGMRTVGASLLASAGVASIIAGLAAQSSLANVFAGMQIAFTDAIRVDDVVIVAGEWGRIEEITMTYVVVHIWDDRRLVLPSTYFTTTPFQNWTRRAAALLGTVEIDVDWTVPVDAMRAEMNRLLDETDLWDKRARVLQVTEATGGFVRVRALASAKDAPTLFDLRCYLREGLVKWIREADGGLPRTRLQTLERGSRGAVEAEAVRPLREEGGQDTAESRLFTGNADAEDRSRSFAGPGQGVIEEREQTAERAAVTERTAVSGQASASETQVLPRRRSIADVGGTHGG
jgi:small-conductance mechanosensitive channel